MERYGSPLFLIDAERVRAQYRRLSAALPGVDLFSRSSPAAPAVAATLRDCGSYFDLATNGEVELVRRLGIAAERCIHTHPIKRDGDIRTALSYGVTHFVIDNPDELRKFAKHKNRAAILIRWRSAAPTRYAICRVNSAAIPKRCRDFSRSPPSFASGLRVSRSTPARRRATRE